MEQTIYDCSLQGNTVQLESRNRSEKLKVTFQRTLRIPDTHRASFLPTGLGEFPLYKVNDFKSNLPSEISKKGGLLMPMHQREAMWINFEASSFFAVKIYVRGINTVSGQPLEEGPETSLRRRKRQAASQSLQDYLVVPEQPWLDGIVSEDGFVRQFVAMPIGEEGYSTEAQIAGGLEAAGGSVQFEITPAHQSFQPSESVLYGTKLIWANTVSGQAVALFVSPQHLVIKVKEMICEKEGSPINQQRLMYKGKTLEDDHPLSDYDIPQNAILHVFMRIRGGFGDCLPHGMGTAAGGRIPQSIYPDRSPVGRWNKEATMVFNVQILNAMSFQQVTGLVPPPTLVSAKVYAEHGLAFFDLPEEQTAISGSFDRVGSVAEINGEQEENNTHSVITSKDEAVTGDDPDSLLNPNGPLTEFRHISVIRDELTKHNLAKS